MRKGLAAVLAAVVLTSCASLDFYAPEVGADWSNQMVKADSNGVAVDGVTVKKVSEGYSDVVSVGSLLAPAYQGGRFERWSVEGPAGFTATIDLIQTGLVFSGPVTNNVLNADMTDFTKARQVVRLTKGTEAVSEPGPVTSPPVVLVSGFGVEPVYQGISAGKVGDYRGWGMATGLRLSANGSLAAYLNLTNGASLKKGPGAVVDPQLTALALVSAQPHFEGKTPAQKVVPEVIEIFGLKLTSQVSHN